MVKIPWWGTPSRDSLLKINFMDTRAYQIIKVSLQIKQYNFTKFGLVLQLILIQRNSSNWYGSKKTNGIIFVLFLFMNCHVAGIKIFGPKIGECCSSPNLSFFFEPKHALYKFLITWLAKRYLRNYIVIGNYLSAVCSNISSCFDFKSWHV